MANSSKVTRVVDAFAPGVGSRTFAVNDIVQPWSPYFPVLAAASALTDSGVAALPAPTVTATPPSPLDQVTALAQSDAARLAAPGGVAAASGYFRHTSLYNVRPENTRATRRGMSKANLATSGQGAMAFQVCILGASISFGYNGSISPDVCSMAASLSKRSVIELGLAYGGGWQSPSPSNVIADSRFTLAGGFVVNPGSPYAQCSTSGGSITWVSDTKGTVVDVLIWDNSGAPTLTIDGTAKTLTLGGTPTLKRFRFTGLTSAFHTVVITTTSAATCTVNSFRCLVNGSNGVPSIIQVQNRAVAGVGATTYDIGGLGEYYELTVAAAADAKWPDLVVVGLDVVYNDFWGGTPLATSFGYITALVANLQAAGSDVVLVLPCRPSPAANANLITDAVFGQIRQMSYTLADSANVPLIDFDDRWGGFTAGTAAGWFYDYAHPSPFGCMDQGDALVSMLDQL